MSNFADVLNVNADDIRPPQPLPQGTYLCVVDGVPDTNERKEYDIIEYKLKIVAPQADVDMSGYDGNPAGKILRRAFMYSKVDPDRRKETNYYHLSFLKDHLGIDAPGATIGQLMAAAPGRQVLASVSWDAQPDRVYERVKSTAHV